MLSSPDEEASLSGEDERLLALGLSAALSGELRKGVRRASVRERSHLRHSKEAACHSPLTQACKLGSTNGSIELLDSLWRNLCLPSRGHGAHAQELDNGVGVISGVHKSLSAVLILAL